MRYYFLLFFFFVFYRSFSQNGTFKGKLLSEKGEPVVRANVRLENTKYVSITNSNGFFEIKSVPANIYQLVITCVGFNTIKREIAIADGQTVEEIITLQENPLELQQIDVFGQSSAIQSLPPVQGTYIFAGKKSEVVNFEKMDVNRVDNNPRQLFAKVPGIFVYETDGTGNQINIAARGLDTHRSWEFNVRHNGVITNTDLYGYPASHFSPPTESIERVEIVRGSGSLQYGAQFGGMVNYISKSADTTKKISFQTQQSGGSYGLMSTFNALSGKVGKWKYYSYLNYRQSDGYRQNSQYHYLAYHADIQYDFSSKLNLRFEYNRMYYVNHINGGLTDAQFYQNSRQSTRSRNYYSPDIHLPSIQLNYKISDRTNVNFTSSVVLGNRSSVQFIALSTVKDTFNTIINSYNPRQVDIDYYNSYANEARLVHHYTLFKIPNTFVSGVRYIDNNLIRKQLGKGTTGSDYDLTLTNPVWGRDLAYHTKNVSIFLENLFQITPKLSLTAGIRYENGDTHTSGKISYYDPVKVPVSIAHKFALLGFGGQYNISKNITLFANWAQAYRPVIFADLIPSNALNQVNPNIHDASGNNAEIGMRGDIGNFLHLDATLFNLVYNNRIGDLVLKDDNNNAYFYKTNTGNSLSQGLELYAEILPLALFKADNSPFQISVFTSTSYINARYIKGTVANSGENKNIKGNRVEVAPRWISRNGFQVRYKGFSTSFQYSFVDKIFSDAYNTVQPNASGTVGLVPGYQLADWNFTYRFLTKYNIKLAMNNVFNKQYFTERPSFFPGPGGLYPSDGRSFILSVGAKF